ncbi:MAG: FMN-binding glutamate synthase family protein [Piscirickettsiaceae bacterium]|nr:FMN-binding glutamate synthase family protein [Piscirickettsiaceae bacterium]
MYFMAALFILAIVLLILWVMVVYVIDVTQTDQTIRRNYPVIGRFRYLFEHVGEFFRQYFFAMDREELPFNRAQRSWVYRAAKNVDSTVAFGSTDNVNGPGRVLFINCTFPTLGEDAVPPIPVTIGEQCKEPYTTDSIINISGMSFGAISRPAVQALSAGAKAAGCWMNTGEGGLSQYHLEGGADIVFQIGTAKNGVRDIEGNLNDEKLKEVAAHAEVKMFEIKMSQGAKPGKGGILPGEKVTEEIANIRGIEVGQDALSPNRHTDINSFDDLIDMINQVRNVTGKPTGFKMVVGAPRQLDDLFSAIKNRGIESAPDFITIDGAEGGTGAAPMALIDTVGMPLRASLPIVIDKLNEYGLRDRIRVIASGKLITPAAVAWALCIGTDFVTSARGFMFSLGCIQALQCNKNTCPTGITTHDPKLQRGLHPASKAVRVTSYVKNMVKEVGVIAHSCGVKNPRALNRSHALISLGSGKIVAMDELYPNVVPTQE